MGQETEVPMPDLAHHVILRLTDGRVLASSVEARRGLASLVLNRGPSCGLLAFRGSDTHLHALMACGRDAAGRWVQALSCALRWGLAMEVPFRPAHILPIQDQVHLENAFSYVLRQDTHHGFRNDPCHEASALPDLVGLRVRWPDLAGRVRERLPRWDRARLEPLLGVERFDEDIDPSVWMDAAAATVGLPVLGTRDVWSRAARRALLDTAGARMSGPALRQLLGTSRSGILRLKEDAADPALVRAVTLQARFRTTLARSGGSTADPGLPAVLER
jgi:hypothetical protein